MRSLLFLPLMLAILVSGCSSAPTSPKQIAKRQTERAGSFATLSSEHQQLVLQGQIQVGMPEDGVYIAWGKPAQVLRRGDAQGEETIWLYTSSTTDEYVNWSYVERQTSDGRPYLDRVSTRDYAFRDYVSARLVFRQGAVASWEMLPQPPGSTIYGTGGVGY